MRVIRIMTYNVDARFGQYQNINKWKEFITIVDSINPDIILPQEFDFYGGDSLRNALNIRYLNNSKTLFGKGYYTTEMIFSKYPIKSYEYLLGFPKTIYKLVVDVDGQDIAIINCHLASNNFSSTVREGRTNYLEKLQAGYEHRRTQTDSIVAALSSNIKDPLLVCGDFNDVSGSYTLRTLQDKLELQDAWWNGGCGFGFTYHGYGIMRFRLDHILYNKHFELQHVDVPHVGFSDHWPVVADFVIKR